MIITDSIPIIRDNNIVIRRLMYSDVDFYANNLSAKYYTKYMETQLSVIDISRLRAYLIELVTGYENKKYDKGIRFTLYHTNGSKIGGCAILPYGDNNISFAYFIIPLYQNKGYCIKMMELINKYAIKDIKGYNNICIKVHKDNNKSLKIAEKLGYKLKETKDNFSYYWYK